MESKFDLNKIIKRNKLDADQIAKNLFPENNYPASAMRRVLNGDAFLNTNQVSTLSDITGIPIDKLFDAEEWRSAMQSKDVISFTNGNYRAELDRSSWTTRIFNGNDIFVDKAVISKFIPLSEYLFEIEKLIEKYKSNV